MLIPTVKTFLQVVAREIKRISGSWILLFSGIVAPIMAYLLIYAIFQNGVIRDLPVGVVDLDNSATAVKIINSINSIPEVRIATRTNDLNTAKLQLVQGDVDAVIVLNKNLERNIFSGTVTDIPVYINNSNLIKGGIVFNGLEKTIKTISAGISLKLLANKGMSQEQAMFFVRPVAIDTHMLFNPYGNYSYFLAAGLITSLTIVFILLVTLYAIGSELRFATAPDFMKTAKNNIFIALAGKLIPYAFMFMLQFLMMNLLFFKVMGIPLNGSLFWLIVSQVVLIIVYQLIAVFILYTSGNLRFSLSIGSAYSMMALTFSGLTFPVFGMPQIAQWFSSVFPYSFWLKIFLSQSLRGEPIFYTTHNFIYLSIFGLIGILSIPGLKKRMCNPINYGRK